jgi:ubiquinone/menaquinone biosynthesis C-methylase UbiE
VTKSETKPKSDGNIEWSAETSRAYARYMETNVPHDHRVAAKRIAADWPTLARGATVVDVAGGPAFLLLELAPLLAEPRLVVTDGSAEMIELGHERAKARGFELEGHVCPAEQLTLADGSADLVVCKHFLRLASDLDASLREMARILRPGGRAYFVDFNAERPWLGSKLLQLWILFTAPSFIRWSFGKTMALGLPASSLPARLRAAGFASAEVLRSSVSYLVRATR